jgi:hypothetical protein
MNAEEFLKTKGIGKPTIKAVRLPHKYKNIELELIPLMEEYAKLKLLGIGGVSQQRELLDLLTEIANSDTLYSNTKHRMIARKLLKSNCG